MVKQRFPCHKVAMVVDSSVRFVISHGELAIALLKVDVLHFIGSVLVWAIETKLTCRVVKRISKKHTLGSKDFLRCFSC